ncbi:MAG TPA: serine/threonine-protein kinase [Fimbriiglobus sp.]|nr:serine/threonine-protein kinase [Fimbriiglobus sp.]
MGADLSVCPPPGQLEQLLAEQLGGQERDDIESHVELCHSCQERLDRLIGAPPALSARTDDHPGATPPEPDGDFLDRLSRLSSPAGKPVPVVAVDWLENGRIGQYEILGKLGRGGMGAVYRARHVELGKVVALKVLPTEQVCEVNVARFKQEIRAIGRLEHPNIVTAHDAGQHRSVHFLVMALVDGVDLGRLVECRGPLAVADACELARQAAVGLQHAYERGLVHRDVKPQNLMLARDGTVKVLDLGLARSFADAAAETLTAAGALLGTADYLAPEQWESPSAADTRSDIYGLGCTLYHLLAGHPPFADELYRKTLMKMQAHQEVPPPPITGPRPDVPDGLAAVLERMLAKKPGDRYASPAEVAEVLRPFAAGADLGRLLDADGMVAVPSDQAAAATPGPAKLKTTPGRGRPATTRRRYMLPAVAGLGLSLLAAVLLWPPFRDSANPAAKPLAITEMRVTHYRGNGNERYGDLRMSDAVVRLNDSVEVVAELSSHAYCYLIAFNPKGGEGGIEQLCSPEGKEEKEEAVMIRPAMLKEVRYPRKKAFVLDVAGLQAFVIAASTKPLPSYGEWRKAKAIPWTGVNDGGDSRWHFDGKEFTRYYPGKRGRLQPREGAPKPLRELCDWFKGRAEFEAVQAFAFPVVDEK